tara:strand:+ start:1128 stop:2144 length:1017 start_codon:yes stop_codon:yes gene_type:complete
MSTALNIRSATENSPMLINLSYKKPDNSAKLIDLLEQELQKYKDFTLCLSGGYDSQFVFLLLKQFNINFKCVTYSMLWEDDVVNANDFMSAQRLCKKHNVELDTTEIDAKHFFDTGKFGNTAKKYQCFSPQIALHCDFLENLSDENLLLGGDISKIEYDFSNSTFGKNAGIFENNILLTKQFVGNYSVPYFNVSSLTGKNIVKNVLLLTPEIYYLSILHNINIIEKYKVVLGLAHNTEVYRYKEYYYNELLQDQYKLSFRLKACTGFETLKAHLASVTGNIDEFNDRYRDQTIRMNSLSNARYSFKGDKTELDELQKLLHNKIKQIQPEIIEDFIIEI